MRQEAQCSPGTLIQRLNPCTNTVVYNVTVQSKATTLSSWWASRTLDLAAVYNFSHVSSCLFHPLTMS